MDVDFVKLQKEFPFIALPKVKLNEKFKETLKDNGMKAADFKKTFKIVKVENGLTFLQGVDMDFDHEWLKAAK